MKALREVLRKKLKEAELTMQLHLPNIYAKKFFHLQWD